MKFHSQTGFTLIELMITVSIFLILVGIVVANVLHLPAQFSLGSTTTNLMADLNSQQLRSMSGDTEGSASAKTYGIYFLDNKYVLFSEPYTTNDPNNLTVSLGSDLLLTTTFSNSQVEFSRVSGEVVGFTNGSNTITLLNINTNEKRKITINRYGVPILN